MIHKMKKKIEKKIALKSRIVVRTNLFGCFGALRGAPGVTDGECVVPGG